MTNIIDISFIVSPEDGSVLFRNDFNVKTFGPKNVGSTNRRT